MWDSEYINRFKMSSWFSDLAGEAENILNEIDQNAASVLNIKTHIINEYGKIKKKVDRQADLNHWPFDLQSNALPLSYASLL